MILRRPIKREEKLRVRTRPSKISTRDTAITDDDNNTVVRDKLTLYNKLCAGIYTQVYTLCNLHNDVEGLGDK